MSIQGFHFRGNGNTKKPARVAAVGEHASTDWQYEPDDATRWFYDVDPLPNGTLLVSSTTREETVIYEYDPDTGERVWEERFPFKDTHDVDLVNGNELLIANMRGYDEENDVSNDRILIYNRTTGETVWEWRFRDHYPRNMAGGVGEDWTHVNDVDKIGEGRYLVSPRDFDQVIVVNRSTNEITRRLGGDQQHDILNEQHNPDYLETLRGNPVLLVSDSHNDRVVEYTYEDGDWVETWAVTGFNWPRDADRLPNGNTLVTDSMNHRIVEITPHGEIVWRYNATWAPYDAERIAHGGGSSGPTMHDAHVNGTYAVSGGASRQETTLSSLIRTATAGTPFADRGEALAVQYRHAMPWIKPVWMAPATVPYLLLALLVLVGWSAGEVAIRCRDYLKRL